ncbi:hypothetical protein ASPWEDRAFT_171980 [Aspergillus wentii DTO 134E9]|uniref:Sulfite efflux pump SSU1 n=1 Tax=Aspergillus wentii DTO 134E9 TaxID=1073089 RepID=A0A1L9RJS0_ASPWE|nr:uncharacterized protein ASPWEDRAFT_171980 [Aspergillus wentii DTO 134E9]OJJ35153.1 hypothetical protein ASPWEDRAFT_171980 [Aspergillus wentii DTO 134E9]
MLGIQGEQRTSIYATNQDPHCSTEKFLTPWQASVPSILSSSSSSKRFSRNILDSELDESHGDGQSERHDDCHDDKCSTELEVGWRRVIHNFTPSWFSVTMGTGIVSTILYTLPYNGRWLYWISVVIFAVNVFLFTAGCILSLLRYTMYPKTFKNMLTHPVQSMFIGTFPMGLATLINMFCFVCVPVWGQWTRDFAWAMWIIDAVISVATALSLPFLLMSTRIDTQLSSMTAVWLMPIITCVVAAGTGAIVADNLAHDQYALWTIIASYILWGMGIPLSMMVFVIYFQRLTIHKLPPKEVIVSVFLPLGPLGSGAFSMMKLGSAARAVLPKNNSLDEVHAASIIYVICFAIALLLWAFGLVWFFFASASIVRCKRFPFNIGWWGFTFPLGAYAMATCEVGRELASGFFKVLGMILSILVVLLWIVVSTGTLKGIISGRLFMAPCLAEMKQKQKDAAERPTQGSV